MKKESKSVYAILGILSSGPRSGYDIKKFIESSIHHFWNEGYGQIYPALKLLVEQGLVNVSIDENDGRPDRKVYTITHEGMDKLKEWLPEPFSERSFSRNELLLKLFFGRGMSIEDNINHVREYMHYVENQLETYNLIEKNLVENTPNNPNQPYWLITLKHGQALDMALLSWCRESILMLENMNQEK
jgi:DNA-binding PadR family transcriptional regulator